MTDEEVLALIEAVSVNFDGLLIHLKKHLEDRPIRKRYELALGEDIVRDGLVWLAKAVKK